MTQTLGRAGSGLAVAILFAMGLGGALPARAVAADVCGRLASKTLPNATVTLVESVPAGGLPELDGSSRLPAFCRIAATLKPSRDSAIKIELWMPVQNWNGKLQAVGNGAFNGSIAYPAMAAALERGYATSSTDTGHEGAGASFAMGHPEKVADFGWRAVHELTVASKSLIGAYYDTPLKHSYWNGCSAGGRQAMKEAQKFPADFDGIIAGAPGLDWTSRASQAVRVAKVLEKNESARLGPDQLKLLHAAVLDSCDALDGLKDGLIEAPRRCTFDPAALMCHGSGDRGCLTAAQVDTARLLYSSGTNTKTKREITGLERGSELGWTNLGWTASARATGLDQFRFIVFSDPSWTIQKFDFDADLVRAEELDNNTINALDPNLRPFLDRGGKLLQYHGWSDPQISPGNSVQYYERVVAAVGDAERVQRSYRLFMVPGMGHCGGGEGTDAFDKVGALEQWVEAGRAPDRIIAGQVRDGRVARTRPLCPYPAVAVYNGSGSVDDAANFTCRVR